ncbi:MAG: beta-propeller domain-containing protein [Eubacteriaceae bacterium]
MKKGILILLLLLSLSFLTEKLLVEKRGQEAIVPTFVSECSDYKLIEKLAYSIKNNAESQAFFLNETSSKATDVTTGSSENFYTSTNRQVANVDEGDLVKTDGNYLYTISKTHVNIFKVDGPEITLLWSREKTTETSNSQGILTRSIFELYISENRLVLLENVSSGYSPMPKEGNPSDQQISSVDSFSNPRVNVLTYDTTNIESPQLLSTLGQSGNIISSRLVDHYLYLATNDYYGNDDLSRDPKSYVPSLFIGETQSLVQAERIAICPYPTSITYVNITGINLSAPTNHTSVQSVLGNGTTLYSTTDTMILASNQYNWDRPEAKPSTDLIRCSLDQGNVKITNETSVSGTLLNQFSMDIYNGNLRIVTTDNNFGIMPLLVDDAAMAPSEPAVSSNHLYILDEHFEILGNLTNIAPGEQLYAVRFMEDTGYFVTFKQVDPLFTVDLRNPENPQIIGALKIPGFSNYLHPWSENLLLGFGQNVSEETGENLGLKLSMFNLSDKENVYEASIYLLDSVYQWSDALYDHKAFFAEPSKGVLGFPGDDEYLLFSYDVNTGFSPLITFVNANANAYDTSPRGLLINDYFYCVSSSKIFVVDLTSPGFPIQEIKIS